MSNGQLAIQQHDKRYAARPGTCSNADGGAPGPTRTDGLRIRSPTLYPAELRAHGVSEGTRTLDHWGHNPVLYPPELHSPSFSISPYSVASVKT
jgi:hypothetical protein